MALRCCAGFGRAYVRWCGAPLDNSLCRHVSLHVPEGRRSPTVHLSWRSISTDRQGDKQHNGPSSMLSLYVRLNDKIGQLLQRAHPTAGKVYVQFINGAVQSWREGKTAAGIMRHKHTLGRGYARLTWREVDCCRQFKLDVLKTLPVFLLASLPFIWLLVLPLIYFYPKQLLSSQFWSAGQRVTFFNSYHMERVAYYPSILQALHRKAHRVEDFRNRTKLQELCSNALREESPSTAAIMRVRPTFSHPGLHFNKLSRTQLAWLSRTLLLTPYLPKLLLRRRLLKHLEDVHAMDRGIQQEGLSTLSTQELRKVSTLSTQELRKVSTLTTQELRKVSTLTTQELRKVSTLTTQELRKVSTLSTQELRKVSTLTTQELRKVSTLSTQELRKVSTLSTQELRKVSTLSTQELRKMCYIRGVDSISWSRDTCVEWLTQWLQISTQLQASELCLLVHCMVFLSSGHSHVK
ncbi:LETM1 domain-containing protein 1-like isoform X1 [Branchiostoma floridae]|uniref:LETM1 domain-containing protein 1-like isoform X1 n=1 Tax=Branchiostoma floridae TaxID=7739 RepID=A0A9J7HKX8_BRAFL|nr:LETM1 domain-containing protein 1-like isoform X1 [Branchiostoma floridae]